MHASLSPALFQLFIVPISFIWHSMDDCYVLGFLLEAEDLQNPYLYRNCSFVLGKKLTRMNSQLHSHSVIHSFTLKLDYKLQAILD